MAKNKKFKNWTKNKSVVWHQKMVSTIWQKIKIQKLDKNNSVVW